MPEPTTTPADWDTGEPRVLPDTAAPIAEAVQAAGVFLSTEEIISVLLRLAKQQLTVYEAAVSARRAQAGLPAPDFSTVDVGEVFQTLRRTMTLSSQDWSTAPDFATLWAILVGWDNLDELAARFGWTPKRVADLQRMHALVESVQAA